MTDTLTGRALDALIAERFELPLEVPCARYHSTDEAEYEPGHGWSGWCYTCSSAINAVPPEAQRYSTDPAACRLVEDAIERRELRYTYLDALCRELRFSTDGISGSSEHFDFSTWMAGFVSGDALWALIRATPEERCHAALIAVGEG